MSDNPTQEMPDSRSFEERVFARFDTLDLRMTTLEEKADSRLRDTRPIWEAMQADLANVKEDVAKVKDDLANVKSEVKVISRNVMLLHEDNLRMRSDQRELPERVEKLESEPTS